MSSEIDTTNNRVNMAAAFGINVWWECGDFKPNRVDPSAPIEEWRAAALPFEIKKANVKYAVEIDCPAQSDWEIEMDINSDREPMNQERELKDSHSVLYRTDTGDYISTVSNQYHLHTIEQVTLAAARVVEQGGYQMATVGSLRDGKEIWFQAMTDRDVSIAGEKFNRNVLLGTSYDKTTLSYSMTTDVAVVCNNTLQAALRSGSNVFKLSHRNAFDESYLVGSLKALGEQQARNAEIIEELATSVLSDNARREFFDEISRHVTPTKAPWSDSSKTKRVDNESWAREFYRAQADAIESSYQYGPGGVSHRNKVDSRDGTLHGATQAVYHWVDHKLLKKQDGGYKANYFQTVNGLQGKAGSIKRAALIKAARYAGIELDVAA
jgi:phage/plasmid-like protein (TIGR03299 family)